MIILKIVFVVFLLIFFYNLIGAMSTTRALMKIKEIQMLGIMREWDDFSRRSEAEYQEQHPKAANANHYRLEVR